MLQNASYVMRNCNRLEQNMRHLWNQQPKVSKKQVLSGGQSTQIKYLSKSTDTYNKILLQ